MECEYVTGKENKAKVYWICVRLHSHYKTGCIENTIDEEVGYDGNSTAIEQEVFISEVANLCFIFDGEAAHVWEGGDGEEHRWRDV